MKKPSRFMPKYIPKKASPISVVVAILILIGVAIVSPISVAVLVGIAIFITVWSYLERPKIDKFYENLYAQREGLSICDFSKEFDCKEIDAWIIRAVYEQIQENIPFEKEIPIKGGDNLKEDLGFDDDDLDLDLAEQIFQRTGRTMKGCESNPYYGKVNTVRDLVLFFNHQPNENAT